LTQAAANGSAAQDIIQFNLSDISEAGRTIALLTQLPDLSSNLIIDGTTQPGALFGKSNARIEISTPNYYYADAITVFNGNGLNNVTFYGLYIFDLYDIGTSYPDLKTRTAVKLVNCSNIIFGAIGKGNMVRGFNGYSLDLESTDQIKIQSNIIGLGKSNTIGDDGRGYIAGYTGIINISKCNNIMLGGDIGEGNIIFTMMIIDFYQQTNSNMSIKSNNFCVYQDGTSTEWYFEFYAGMIRISGSFSSTLKSTAEAMQVLPIVNMDISNNLTGSQMLVFGFKFLTGTINFINNYFNIARDGVTDIKYLTQTIPPQLPIDIRNTTAQINIGTNDINKKKFL
jgi:hypothetical protein